MFAAECSTSKEIGAATSIRQGLGKFEAIMLHMEVTLVNEEEMVDFRHMFYNYFCCLIKYYEIYEMCVQTF